jgi:3-hydroxyacyl-[acyl-carrier-protein] dehydratase
MSLAEIHAAIPHREPFLLVDEIVERSIDRIVCRKTFSGNEFWYQGHYPEFPITPGVLLCEAAMQAGAILLSERLSSENVSSGPGTVPVATRANNVQFKKIVLPGETIQMEVELIEQLASAFFLKARITVDSRVAARLDFACTLTRPEDQ